MYGWSVNDGKLTEQIIQEKDTNVYGWSVNDGKLTEQIIQEKDTNVFGWSVAVDGHHMAVSSNSEVFTYKFDVSSNKWVNSGRLAMPHWQLRWHYVSMQKNILVATMSEEEGPPSTFCGHVYKLSETNNNNNTNDNTNDNNDDSNNNNSSSSAPSIEWRHVAVLTTYWDPMESSQSLHASVGIDGELVYVGRRNIVDYGRVFVYNISQIID